MSKKEYPDWVNDIIIGISNSEYEIHPECDYIYNAEEITKGIKQWFDVLKLIHIPDDIIEHFFEYYHERLVNYYNFYYDDELCEIDIIKKFWEIINEAFNDLKVIRNK